MSVNWESKMDSIEKTIRSWTMRNLSMVGKIQIVKSLLASKFSYIGSIIDLPHVFINRINSLFFKFVWGGSEKVKRSTLSEDYGNGGLQMLNFKYFLDSLKISWLKKLISPDKDTWKIIPLHLLSETYLGLNILKCNCSLDTMNKLFKSKIYKLPMFYRNLIKTWFLTKCSQNIDQVETWENQVIWNNECITNRGKTLYFNEFAKKGIIYVSDLYNKNREFKSMEELKCKFKNDGSYVLKYIALSQAMPLTWKTSTNSIHNIDDVQFIYGENSVKLSICTTKQYRRAMQSQMSLKPRCQRFWEKKFENIDFDWFTTWKTLVQDIKEPRLKTLNWKIINNIYPTKVFLKKIKKEDNNICETCNEIDYIEHFFYSCKKIRLIWKETEKILLQQHNVDIKIMQKDVLFGYHDVNTNRKKVNIINACISVVKSTISKYIYGKHPNLLSVLYVELKIRKLL